MIHTASLAPITPDELYQLTLRSAAAQSGQVFIYERGQMDDLFSKTQAEEIRAAFLKNHTKVQQITNLPTVAQFSENDDFINQLMTFRYVPENIFKIDHEILIFDNTVAVYTPTHGLVIEDAALATAQKQLFALVWDQGQSPKLEFDYKPNHSFYNNLNFWIDGRQMIVWPDADAKKSYGTMTEGEIGTYIQATIRQDPDWQAASYFIVFMWSYETDRMLDIWFFTNNHVDDRSGPLGNVRIFREGKRCDDLGMASGNTLLVLGHEEKMRRQSKNLQNYLDGPPPTLPLEIMNGKDFFAD